jgi:putative flippase GtrA
MLRQYLKFFVNGGVLGVVAWALQATIYQAIRADSGLAYGVATALTYIPLVVVNFMVQRRLIFKQDGLFARFIVANVLIMLLVSVLSAVCRLAIAVVTTLNWADQGGFILAALLGSIPSFLLMKYWVFGPLRP